MKNKSSKYKIYYSDFEHTKEVEKFFNQCSQLIKLNHLLKVGLINQTEYEKIKKSIGFVASL